METGIINIHMLWVALELYYLVLELKCSIFFLCRTFSRWQGQAARFPDALKSNSLQPKLLPSTKFAVSTGCTWSQNPFDAALQMTMPETRYSNPCARYQTPTSAAPNSSQREAQIGRNRAWKLETRSPITREQQSTIFPLKEIPRQSYGGKHVLYEALSDSSLWATYDLCHTHYLLLLNCKCTWIVH
jgi:hypothetical protein